VSIFDTSEEHPPAKIRRYIITVVAFFVVAFLFVWYWLGLRYYKEKGTIRQFMNAVVAGDMRGADRIWKPSPQYSFNDFLEDWGPNGYYGTIRSYKLGGVQGVKNGPSVAVVVEVSPFATFPSKGDEVKENKIQKIVLWVDPKDQSITFPPY